MNVLVTGGAGYIGSHTCLELLESGYGVVVIDNLVNSNAESLNRVQKLTGKELTFYEGDVRDEALLRTSYSMQKRSRICKLTQPHSRANECGCVASRMRLRESVIHVSFFNKSSESHARHASLLISLQALQHVFSQHASAIRYESES